MNTMLKVLSRVNTSAIVAMCVLVLFAGSAFAQACINNPVVTNNLDNGPGSLRQAVIDACPGSTITFDMNTVVSPISLSGGRIVLDKNLIIQGPGAAILTILNTGPNNSSSSYDFNVTTGITVTISGLTLSGGNTTSSNFFNGGAITNAGNLTVDQCTISNNNALTELNVRPTSPNVVNRVNTPLE